MRIGELGTVYRYERGGVVHGLLRVRGLTQDDAHIFCRPDQVEDEINNVLDLTFFLLNSFGFTEYEVMLSTKPGKAVGQDDNWTLATDSLRNTLQRRGISFEVDDGGGAFYGPKIDFDVTDAIGRQWQCATIQLDYQLPQRFDLKYTGSDNEEHRPVVIHRAIFGSFERFLAMLVEHYAGAWPLWLAPTQVVVLPISDRHLTYAKTVRDMLTKANLRVELDGRKEKIGYKIREAQLQKVPYMLVIGDRETADNTVAVRSRLTGDLGPVTVTDFAHKALEEIECKSLGSLRTDRNDPPSVK